MTHPYREAEAFEPEPVAARRWAELDAEIVIFVVCAIEVALGIAYRRFGAMETLALLAAVFSARVMLGSFLTARRARGRRTPRARRSRASRG
jgi:hypothetical protein